MEEQEAINANLQEYKSYLYGKLDSKEAFFITECQYLAYFESWESRGDSDHGKGKDPLVGAVVLDEGGHVIAHTHRASGQEGDHAEYSILKGILAGRDLSNCTFFSTLEPCVDDVRSKEGTSCSSLLARSAVKKLYIGILDPNPTVFSRGLTSLFIAGKSITPFDEEIQELIKKSWPGFSRSEERAQLIDRVKKDVFKNFQEGALRKYLEDKYRYINRSSDGFDLSKEEDAFADFLLNKHWVGFEAKEAFVDKGVQIMFYDSEHLKTSNRRVMITDETPGLGAEKNHPGYSDALPLVIERLDSMKSKLANDIDNEIYREAIINALTHSEYDENASLIYITSDGVRLTVKNQACENIPENELKRLETFEANSNPGNGNLVELFNMAGYCERNHRGQKTFKAEQGRVKIKTEGHIVTLEIKAI